MRESAFVNNLIVVVKVSIVLVFIALGFSLISPANLFVTRRPPGSPPWSRQSSSR